MTRPRPSIATKRRIFRQLHASGCFVIPNPWDVGSALFLQSLGFKALATTSSGFAWSRGQADNAISRDIAARLPGVMKSNMSPGMNFISVFVMSASKVNCGSRNARVGAIAATAARQS